MMIVDSARYASVVFLETWGSITGGTLSNADRTATQTIATTEMRTLGSSVIPWTGKWYAEVDMSDTGNFLMFLGLYYDLTTPIAAARSNATANKAAGVSNATLVTYTAGTLQLAIDYPGKQMWMGRNDTWFSSGDPANNLNPYFWNLPAGAWKLWAQADNDSNGVGTATMKLQSGNQTYTPPSGFSPLVS